MNPSDLRDSSSTNPPAESGWGPVIFVWAIWAAMLVAVFVYIATFGSAEMPRAEEWVSVHESLTPRWLWSQYHEHRVPLFKLLWLGTLKLTGYNFRVGHYLTAAALGAMAASWIVGTRRLRGWTVYTDAFFPLVVLSFSQGITYVWWWQVNTILAPILASAFLLIAARHGSASPLRQVVWGGVCLMGLPLCGPAGLPYALLLSPWLFHWAWTQWRLGREGWLKNSLTAAGLGTLALGEVALYFVGYEVKEGVTTVLTEIIGGVTWRQVFDTSLQILSLNLGSGSRPVWPWGGWAVLTLGVLTAGLLVTTWVRRPGERPRVAVFFLFLGAGLGLVVQIARSRAVLMEHYVFLLGHYATLGMPSLGCIYLTWEIYGPPAVRGLVPMCLLAAVLGFFGPTVANAWELGGSWVHAEREQFLADVNEEVTIPILAERYPHLMPGPHIYHPDEVEAVFRQAAQLDTSLFRRLMPGPSVREEPLDLASAKTNRIRWVDGLAVGTGTAEVPASLTFQLKQPQFVHAIRLRFAFVEPPAEHALMTVAFDLSATAAARTKLRPNPGIEQRVLNTKREFDRCTIIINRTIDHFTVIPDAQPFQLNLVMVSVLIPEAD